MDSKKVHRVARHRGGLGSPGADRPIGVCVGMLGINVEAQHTSLIHIPPSEVRKDWGYMPVGPDPVLGGKSSAIHVCDKLSGGILAKMRLSPESSGPTGMGTRSSVAPVVEAG